MMLAKLFKGMSAQKHQERKAELYRNLIRHEARIGGKLFGKIPKGHRREFFCLDERTWVWHEEWIDEHGERRSKTTRYDIRPNGILKAQDGQPYQLVTPQETVNLYNAAKLYVERVDKELYSYV